MVKTINASNLQDAVPAIVQAIKDAVKAAGQSSDLIPSDIESQLAEAFKAAQPYIGGFVGAVVAPESKAAPAPVAQKSSRKSPVSSVNAVWNDRCGRWQNSVTGAFIPFQS